MSFFSEVLVEEDFSFLPLSSIKIPEKIAQQRGLTKDEKAALFYGELIDCVRCGLCIAIKDREFRLHAILTLRLMEWDSDFFGKKIAKLNLFTDSYTPDENFLSLLGCVIREYSKKWNVESWVTEVELGNYKLLNYLLSYGFELLDVRRIYSSHSMRHSTKKIPMLSCVRKYKPGDKSRVMKLYGLTRFDTRFTRDVSLDGKRVREMYDVWLETLLDASSSNVLVFEKSGKVLACGASSPRNLKPYGIEKTIGVGELYVSSPDSVGGYYPLAYQLTADALETYGLMETTTSANNNAACRVLDSLGFYNVSMSFVLRLCL